MRNSLITKLIGFFFLVHISINSALGKNIDNQFLGDQLEMILNQEKYALLEDLFLKKSFYYFNKKLIEFKEKYKDTRWSINTISHSQNKVLLDVKLISSRKVGDIIYNLFSEQTVQIETFKNKIKSYKIINEESILNSENSPLIVKIISPDKVLTGERYEVNLIVEEPFDNALIASGMIVLKNKDNNNISNDEFGIEPNQSGGLFKYIQAPLKPGFQIISAIITHPEGIYSITKKIKVGL